MAYRRYAELPPGDDDWFIFQDGDAMHCTRRWFQLIEAAITAFEDSDVGALVAANNRLIPQASGWQMAQEIGQDENDMAKHFRVGYARLDKYWIETIDVTWIDQQTDRKTRHYKPMSGFFMCIRKAAWISAGGLKGAHGFYHQDHDLHRALRDAGWRILLLPGLYMYHWNRWDRHLSAKNERGEV